MNETIDGVLPVVRLTRGAGSPGHAACWMSALSVLVGDKWTDRLSCVDPVINRLCIWINDTLTDKRRSEIILPRLFDPLGTAGDAAATERRRWHLVTAAVTRWAPIAFDRAAKRVPSLAEWAARLRAFGPVTRDNHAEARKLCQQARVDASAYAYAAAAAAAVAYADADAYAYAKDQFVITNVLPVLDELIEMGPHAKREEFTPRCTPREFACAVGVSDDDRRRIAAYRRAETGLPMPTVEEMQG